MSRVASGLARGRRAAESLMLDSCTITRAGAGKGEWNEETGQYDDPPRIPVYTGKCQFQTSGVLSSNSASDAGERAGTNQSVLIKLPFSELTAGMVAPGDVVEVTACPANPDLIGRKPTIGGKEMLKSFATSRRFILNEVGA